MIFQIIPNDFRIFLTGGNQIVTSVSLTAPSDGVVVVNANGYIRHTSAGTVTCTITTDTNAVDNNLFSSTATAGTARDAFGSSVAFLVSAGAFTANFVCSNSTGAVLHRIKIVAMYFPTRYGP